MLVFKVVVCILYPLLKIVCICFFCVVVNSYTVMRNSVCVCVCFDFSNTAGRTNIKFCTIDRHRGVSVIRVS